MLVFMTNILDNFKERMPLIMGILNITKDSLFDGGKYTTFATIQNRINAIVREGADIIDIGGESSRPGAKSISVDEELSNIIPAVEFVKNQSDIPISIDTYKSEVAYECLKSGAHIINDITGLKSQKMLDLIKTNNCPVIIMHMYGEPATMQNNPLDVNEDYVVLDFLRSQSDLALSYGIKKHDILLDPGIGFGKTQNLNIKLISELNNIVKLGYITVLGVSRKSLVGAILNEEIQNRLVGSTIINFIGITNGAGIIRTHV